MCGRFSLTLGTADILKEFHVDQVLADVKPSYNIAPTNEVAAVINNDGNQLVQFQWGLVPSWAKDSSIGSKMINARAETVAEKPSFKSALKKRRCLVVSDGFYEWKKEGNKKTPYYIHLKSKKPFGFAGLYEVWKSPEGGEIRSCTIITTGPNELIKPVHHRMPVIVPKEYEELWLNTSREDFKTVLSILQPYPAEEMECYSISQFVNSPVNNSPECIKPL